MDAKEFTGKRIVVMGLGRFGGGLAVVRWLVANGAEVVVSDQATADKLTDSIKQLAGLPVTYHLGGHDPADLDQCDLLVVNPAVPKQQSEFVKLAMAQGVPLSSEMNLFIERCPVQKVIGVTGSAGKSTTTAMTGAILTAASAAGQLPKVWVGGNIGGSLLERLGEMSEPDIVVLELSSFQLDDLSDLQYSPPLAVFTNLKPNHLDRHGTMEAYVQAKMNIVRYQQDGEMVFVHCRDDDLATQVEITNPNSILWRYEFDPIFAPALQVPSPHNQDNAAAAVAVARALDVEDAIIEQGLASFTGLPHRLEFVAERKGIRYYNDSKSTTPESARIALEAFDAPVVMLIGGRDKGMPFDELCRLLAERAKAVVCYGEMGPKLSEMITAQAKGKRRSAKVLRADNFEHAVQQANRQAAAGDVVILSPACTSYDLFNNYEQRGEAFRELVSALPA